MPEVGEPIWVESLLSATEWKEQSRIYPKTHRRSTPPRMFECDFKWRYGMGASLKPEEIEIINKRIDSILSTLNH